MQNKHELNGKKIEIKELGIVNHLACLCSIRDLANFHTQFHKMNFEKNILLIIYTFLGFLLRK